MTSVAAELFHREHDPKGEQCRKCDGGGLISGDDEDGVYFETCPKCDGSGRVAKPRRGDDQ